MLFIFSLRTYSRTFFTYVEETSDYVGFVGPQ